MNVVDFHQHSNGLPRNLTDTEALKMVRDLAAEGGRVVFSEHARQRMRQRDVSTQQVMQVLLRGEVVEPVRWDSERRNYRLKLRALTAGEDVEVPCAIDVEQLMGQVVIVITVMVI
ncbi:hypothetical protein CO610_07330 [Lysobacteraceae bacterium NML95-0200]|nr:hypothetical protein CO610_07330 [Xanthomonadaceae bacterium NML95-0200]